MPYLGAYFVDQKQGTLYMNILNIEDNDSNIR